MAERESAACLPQGLGDTVLAKARRAEVAVDPFPHLVIEDALDPTLYAELARTRPRYTDVAGPPPHPSNQRIPTSAWMFQSLPQLPESWARFTARHTQPDILQTVAAVFRDHWPDTLPRQLPAARSAYGLYQRDGFEACEVLSDARLEVNSPVTGAASTHRGPHLDAPNRLFSMLFYMRAPEDDSLGGDLVLYRWRRGRADRLDAFELAPEWVIAAKTVRYAANTLVVFPNSPDALHGVSPRQPTPHERAYVFITAEVGRDLFG
jgi:hypothetical protein